jgi:hypothetical protein
MIRRLLALLVIIGGIAVATPLPAQAQPLQPFTQYACGTPMANILYLKPWNACLKSGPDGAPQLSKITDIWLILLVLLEDAIKIAGYTAAGFVIWGGVKYVKSQGDPGQINEARQVIYNALFGLVLAMLSVAIVNFIAGAL